MKFKLVKKPATINAFKAEYYVNIFGQKHGEYKIWHSNGQIWGYCYYKNGNLHGEFKAWHNNGQLNIHCYYKNDKLHGEYKTWYRNGQLIKKSYFINGKEYSWNEYKIMKIKKILNYEKIKTN